MDVVFHLQGVTFEWDEDKARTNIQKHSITFEEATEVFFDELAVYGDATVSEEERDFVIGYTRHLRLLLIVYTVRGPRTRIISARLVTRTERKRYERGQF